MTSNLVEIERHSKDIIDLASELHNKILNLYINNQQVASSGNDIITMITIFILSCFVGYYVVWKVTPSLHTPLMAVTNAISGIIIIGSIIAMAPSGFNSTGIISFFACMLASINVFGGFYVTNRMLNMFKTK